MDAVLVILVLALVVLYAVNAALWCVERVLTFLVRRHATVGVSSIGIVRPESLPEANVLAVGTWECACGGFKMTLRGTPGTCCLPTCPSCGTVAEIMATPLP